MSGNYRIRYRGSKLQVPVGAIDRILEGTGDSPTFSTIREMFANDVYLRAFRLKPAKNVIDLGANRGFFALIAFAALGCKTFAGVEPLKIYKDTFRLLCEANHLDNGRSRIRLTGDRAQRAEPTCDLLLVRPTPGKPETGKSRVL